MSSLESDYNVYLISNEEMTAKKRFKYGKHHGTKKQLVQRYTTELIHPIVYFFESVTNYSVIESEVLRRLDNYRMLSKTGRKLEWIERLDLHVIIKCINEVIEEYGNVLEARVINSNNMNLKKFFKCVRIENIILCEKLYEIYIVQNNKLTSLYNFTKGSKEPDVILNQISEYLIKNNLKNIIVNNNAYMTITCNRFDLTANAASDDNWYIYCVRDIMHMIIKLYDEAKVHIPDISGVVNMFFNIIDKCIVNDINKIFACTVETIEKSIYDKTNIQRLVINSVEYKIIDPNERPVIDYVVGHIMVNDEWSLIDSNYFFLVNQKKGGALECWIYQQCDLLKIYRNIFISNNW